MLRLKRSEISRLAWIRPPRMLTPSGLVGEGRKEIVRPTVIDGSFSCAQRAIKPLADDGTPVACDNGVREPSRETLNPWMLPVPGVRTYRNRESLLIAASSGVLPVPVFPVWPPALNSCSVPLNPTLYPETFPLPVLVV